MKDPHWPAQPQLEGVPPTQFPLLQDSPTVQMFLSLHVPSLAVRVQAPVAGSHASSVHGLPSSQSRGAWTQSPVTGSQESSVQMDPSSQTGVVPARHSTVPSGAATQRSPRVQASWSSHSVPGRGAPTQAPKASQTSPLVHTFPSLQGAPTGRALPQQRPEPSQASIALQPVQDSRPVQGLPSSHAIPAMTLVWKQPRRGGANP